MVRMLEQELRGRRGALLYANKGIESNETVIDSLQVINANLIETMQIEQRMKSKMQQWQKRIHQIAEEKMDIVRQLKKRKPK